jgi:hypothetical protein
LTSLVWSLIFIPHFLHFLENHIAIFARAIAMPKTGLKEISKAKKIVKQVNRRFFSWVFYPRPNLHFFSDRFPPMKKVQLHAIP